MPSHPIPPDRLADFQETGKGLTTAEAAARQARLGYNDIVVSPPSSWRDLVRNTALDPMIWFLVVVSLLFAFMGERTEALVLMVAMVPLVGMDAYLHRRTQASTQGLASRLAAQAKVLRDGDWAMMPARMIVPGDLLEIAAGELVPADGIIVAGEGLQADESSLTGEAFPVRKQPMAGITAHTRAADGAHWVFAGTRLLTGRAQMWTINTGGATLYGEISRSALAGSKGRTPLQKAVGRLVMVMLAAALFLCALLAAIRLAQGYGLVDAFLSAATLAVAALPEEFPVVFTFFLGVGVYRLARRQALVRRAVVVENIGRLSCICSDKTGTLTEGTLVLMHQLPAEGMTGHENQGDLAAWAALAAREESGDPLDIALLKEATAIEATPLTVFAFTEDRRRETALVRLPDGCIAAVAKGAPETIFGVCGLEGGVLEDWRAQVTRFASTGHKVIAVAARFMEAADADSAEPGDGFEFLGLLAFEDPLRDGVEEAIAACRQAGIRVIMVTGDHPATAEAIARAIGLGGENPHIMLADALELEDVSPDALADVDVIARATPEQKLELVRALRRSGEIVAVTGDGVNDVPALQSADIGIAMGERGTQSAREVASIVLLDDNFRTIVGAIAEGRQLFLNLQLAFAYLLLIHIPFVLSAAVVPLVGHPLLYLPVHVVWLELVIHPTALLVFQDLPSSGTLLPTVRDGAPRFFAPKAWGLIIVAGLLLAGLVSAGFELALGPAGNALGNVVHARSMALGALVCASAGMTAALSRLRGRVSRLIVAAELASLVAFVQMPWLAARLHLEPLHLADWGLVALAGLLAGALAMAVRAAIRPVRMRGG
ncbi:cation-translocating P-type ATPase [Kordiimonas marina]|uniref:cation-translocating P-type ATPase n=1 Tax=Kordiimonas marina TaxID=2872312 RepID=UPI001FF156C3|nr:cation-transporting P-type ATPase [Kordiimonas marina]MCJ9428117.1 cation-transporting P-type ATPase [Kordiimonas marina]